MLAPFELFALSGKSIVQCPSCLRLRYYREMVPISTGGKNNRGAYVLIYIIKKVFSVSQLLTFLEVFLLEVFLFT